MSRFSGQTLARGLHGTRLRVERLEDRRLLSVAPSIPGTVDGYSVSIDRHDAPSEAIDPALDTWVVIHGNKSAPTTFYIDDVAHALHSASDQEQVLTFDWSSIAALSIGVTESKIISVADWARDALTSYGFGGGSLNLVGHSFGAYVASEMAERIAGGVNTIVGLDPAADYPFNSQYNPNEAGEVDFAGNSQFSWTFSVPGGFILYGSTITPGSADEAITVKNTEHSDVVSMFANMLNGVGNADVLQYFPLSRLQAHASGPWVPDQYNHSGNLSSSGTYEAVITATSSGTYADSIVFVNQSDTTPPVVTVTAPNGGEDWGAGSVYDITWTATDDVGVTAVDLYYSDSGPSGPFQIIAIGETNDGVYHWTIPDNPTTNAYVKVVAYDAASNTAEDFSDAPFAISNTPSFAADLANADVPIQGTVNGTYIDTHLSDDTYEAVTERESGGKPQNRYSYLEHKWAIDVTGGSTVTFYVEAYHDSAGEGDNFVFAYSVDDVTYIDMLTVDKTSDDDSYQTFDLPVSLSGTVFVRVTDSDQTPTNSNLDTVYVDHMFIRSSGDPVEVHDVAVMGISALPDPATQGNTVTITVTVTNEGSFEETFDVTVSESPDADGLGTQTVTLAPSTTETLNFNWATDGATSPGDHTITAAAAAVPGEADTADNSNFTTVTVNEAAPTAFSINNVSKREGRIGKTTTLDFTVTRSGGTLDPVTIYFATASDSGGLHPAETNDYVAIPITPLEFGDQITAATISVLVTGDLTPEYDETFLVKLFADPADTIALETAVGTILNDDKGTPIESASATDAALLAFLDVDTSEEENTDWRASQTANELALMMFE